MSQEKKILVVTQKSASKDDPCAGDLYSVGTLATILQILELPDGTVKVLIEGVERVKIKAIEDIDEYLLSEYEIFSAGKLDDLEVETIMRLALDKFEQYGNLSKKIPTETMGIVAAITDASRLADSLANHLPLPLDVYVLYETKKIFSFY